MVDGRTDTQPSVFALETSLPTRDFYKQSHYPNLSSRPLAHPPNHRPTHLTLDLSSLPLPLPSPLPLFPLTGAPRRTVPSDCSSPALPAALPPAPARRCRPESSAGTSAHNRSRSDHHNDHPQMTDTPHTEI